MLNLLMETINYVVSTLAHNAPILALGILVAAAIKVYIDPEKLKDALVKKTKVSIPGSVAFGAFTPFCACGTMAVIVSMLTTALPWGPIMAFLTSSPLMSPDEFILYSGIVGFKFAVALTAASVILGIVSGYITHYIDRNTDFLKNQARFANMKKASSCCGSEISAAREEQSCCVSNGMESSCCTSPKEQSRFKVLVRKYKLGELAKVFYEVGVKQVLVYFSIFAAIGFMINKFVPAALIANYLGSGNIFAVPLLALIGLPLYVNGASSVSVISTLMANGASGGALLAFMITGPGTSAGVIAGLTTIMRKKAIALYIAYILTGGIILGYLYDFLLFLGL